MRLDINYKKNTVRNKNIWRLNYRFLNNQQVTKEIKREIKKFLETNDDENTSQNLWDAAKAVLRGKFITIQSYLKKQEKNWIGNLTLHLKQLEKEEQKSPKISRRKEIIQIQAEINETEMQETIVKINKTKNWFFENINKINKPVARPINNKREKSTKLEMKKERLQQTMQKHKGL